MAGGVGEGDEVITSPFTFCSTANVIVQQRAKPVFVDIYPSDFNLDPSLIERSITPKTKAIIPVHITGNPCAMDRIMAIAREHNLLVIEDAAHAVGANYKGRMVGTIGDVTAFSFYATKNLTTAEGGMATTADSELAETMRTWSLHGMSHDAWKRYGTAGSWFYEVVCPGFKYNMTDIQASLGIHQLRKLEAHIALRERLARRYTEALWDMPELVVPKPKPDTRHAWHLYILQIRAECLKIDRNQFIARMAEENIGVSVHFIPLHFHPWYRSTYGYREGDFPVSEMVYSGNISLPLFPTMKEEDVDYVAEVVRRIVTKTRK